MDRNTPPDPELLTTTQVAGVFSVSNATIKRWATTQQLPYILTPGGHYRFRRADVERLLEAASATP